jgi:serine/threonine protein kinase/tetratricopeptide (TPR) repeat protein
MIPPSDCGFPFWCYDCVIVTSSSKGGSTSRTARWTQEWSLFRRARALPESDRQAFLASECASDRTLLRGVQALLDADDQSSPLLDGRWVELVGAPPDAGSAIVDNPPAGTFPSGTILARRYEIVAALARGGMGIVYEAYDQALGERVAIKVIDTALASSPSVRERFRREVALARRVTHPNVCRIFDLVEDGDLLFLTMELLSGQTLATRLRNRALDERETRVVAEQIALALEAAHRAGVIHRDLKPGNVMLVPDDEENERAVVTDFGLALRTPTDDDDPHRITQSGQILGTLAYMSPEQLEGGSVTAASDLYALGLIIHQMLSGKLPFRSETPVSMALERLRSSPPVAIPQNVDRRWRSIIARCLERDTGDRYTSAGELLRDLRIDTPVARSPRQRRKRFVIWAAIATLMLMGVGITTTIRNRSDMKPATAVTANAHERWVLVGHLENRSGDPLLDGTIERLLERELTDSPLFHIVPRERIRDALGLMKKPFDTPIDARTGRDVALRDGDIQAMITGRIQKLGGVHLIQVELIDPSSERTITTASEEAASTEDIPPAVRRIASQLRSRLGEKLSSIQASEMRLQRVTTPSLKALQLYSKADALVGYHDNAAAAELLKAAISTDPSFASAHIHLAWALHNLERPEVEYMTHAKMAFELSEATTDRESLFIRGSYFQMLGRYDEAAASYKALLQIDPTHYWAVNNLDNLHRFYTHRYEEAVPYAVMHARLRPYDLVSNFRAAEALAIHAGRPAEAAAYIRRGRSLLPSGDHPAEGPALSRREFQSQWLDLYPLHESWMSNDISAVARELEERVARIASLPEPARNASAEGIGRLFLAVGKLEAARSVFETIADRRWREGSQLALAIAGGKEDEIPALLRGRAAVAHRGLALTAFQLARNGLETEAGTLIARIEGLESRTEKSRIEPFVHAAKGELALAEGRLDDALPLLESAVRTLRPSGDPLYFLASQSLAGVWMHRGDTERAQAVLSDAFRQRNRSYPRAQADWMAVGSDLARLYRHLGRSSDANAVQRELSSVLALADDDHPLLAQLLTGDARSESSSR